MGKMSFTLTGKLYEMKRQYPVLIQFEKRMNTVKKELNKDSGKR